MHSMYSVPAKCKTVIIHLCVCMYDPLSDFSDYGHCGELNIFKAHMGEPQSPM